MKGIGAHDHYTVGEIAEYTAGVLAGDLRLATGAHRMAQFGAVEGIGVSLLDGDDQFFSLPVICRVAWV